MKEPQIAEGFRPGQAFHTTFGTWNNGSRCPADIFARLKADGYKLRPATSDELFDDRDIIKVQPIPPAPGLPTIKEC